MQEFTGAASALTEAGLSAFMDATGACAPDLWAVLSVETSGCGFLPDKRPKILFERHKFHAMTGGTYDRSHPDVSAPSAGGYGLGGANQYNRLAEAVALDRESALKSASWGIGQIMGQNHVQAGFDDVETMVAAMVESEDNQLVAMAKFLNATHLAAPLSHNDWIAFALGYNGADYASNNYDGLLAQFHGRFTAGPMPDVDVRAAQVALTFRGYNPHGIDGLLGPGTKSAIGKFQADNGMEETGCVDASLFAALGI